MSSQIQGNLKIMSLPDVLQWISLAQKSGSLIFNKDKEKKVLFFRKGEVTGANSNSPIDKIGEILMRMDKINSEVLEEALSKQKESGELIGDILLGKGELTTQEFVAALERQATQIMYNLFSWKEGEFVFQERLPRQRTIPISIKVDFILMEGMRRVDEWQMIKETFATLDAILDWMEEVPETGEDGDEQAVIHGLVNGKNSILDICDQSPWQDFDTCNYLYSLQKEHKIGPCGIRSPHDIMEDDDVKRLLSRGKAFYQKKRYEDAIPFFDRILTIQPDHKEADRFMGRSISAVQNDLLKSLGSPNAVLEIDKKFRIEEARDLTAAEGFVLSRIDGKSTAKEITYISGLSQTEACITLNRLLEKGIIRAGQEKASMHQKKKTAAQREILDPKKKRMTDDLVSTPLSEIILDIIKQRQTGILQLISAPMDIRIYFQAGSIAYASSNMESDRCGSIMLRKGKITREQYESVTSLSEQEAILQGNALVKLGIITPNDLIWLTKTKVEEILYSIFGWRKGNIRFFETDLDGLDIIQLKISPGRMVLEGTWRYFEEEEILKSIGSWDVLFDIVDTPSFSRRELDLTENETEILGHVNGRKSIAEIAEAVRLDKLEVLKVLFGFHSIGLIIIIGEAKEDNKEEAQKVLAEMKQKWDELQGQNCYQILNLEPHVSERETQKAFFQFTKKYHPDKCFRYTNQEILDLMLKIFLSGKEAYEVLTDTVQRKEYDHFLEKHGKNTTIQAFQEYTKPNIEVSNIMKAEEFFNKAKTLLFSGRTGDALKFLQQSYDLVPDDPDYNAYLGLGLARLKEDQDKAIGLIKKAMETNPKVADYHAYLGEAYLRFGKKRKAREAFEEALEINPRHIMAKREYLRLKDGGK